MLISRNDPLDNESQMLQLRKKRGMMTHFGKKITILLPADKRGTQMGGLQLSASFSSPPPPALSFLQPAVWRRTHNDISIDGELRHINIHLPCQIIWFMQGS